MANHPATGDGTITRQDLVSKPAITPLQPRARGEVALSVKARSQDVSSIADLRQAGALKALFPRGAGPALRTILVNTAGGITGGDRFDTRIAVQPGSHLQLTTQAAERAYRAQPDETGRVANRLRVDRGARLDWLPQETILYDGCRLQRRLVAEIARGARLLLVEPLVFGRGAMGETLRSAHFRDRIEIRQAGKPLYLDAIALSGDIAAQLEGPAVAGGAGAMASVVFAAPEAAAHLDPLRRLLPETAGASMLADDLLAVRLLATDAFALRQTLIPVLLRLTDNDLPRSWMT